MDVVRLKSKIKRERKFINKIDNIINLKSNLGFEVKYFTKVNREFLFQTGLYIR